MVMTDPILILWLCLPWERRLYPLGIKHGWLENGRLTIDLAVENGGFSIVVLNYQRVTERIIQDPYGMTCFHTGINHVMGIQSDMPSTSTMESEFVG